MHQLNLMMDHQDLPRALRLRLRSFFLQNRYQAYYLTQQDLLKEMSPQLQSEVQGLRSLDLRPPGLHCVALAVD